MILHQITFDVDVIIRLEQGFIDLFGAHFFGGAKIPAKRALSIGRNKGRSHARGLFAAKQIRPNAVSAARFFKEATVVVIANLSHDAGRHTQAAERQDRVASRPTGSPRGLHFCQLITDIPITFSVNQLHRAFRQLQRVQFSIIIDSCKHINQRITKA